MSDLISKIYSDLYMQVRNTGDHVSEYFVTSDEYLELLRNNLIGEPLPLKPTPPTKTVSEISGLFFSSRRIEYDHYAPDYLRELEKYYRKYSIWEEAQLSGKNRCILMGPKKQLEIILTQ